MQTVETIPDFLNRMAEKDLRKGSELALGWRTAPEIAEYFGISYYRARKALESLADRGLVNQYSEERPFYWGPATSDDGDDDPDGGEPIPDNDNEVDASPVHARTGE